MVQIMACHLWCSNQCWIKCQMYKPYISFTKLYLKLFLSKCPFCSTFKELTHWGGVTHICVGKLTIIDSDNGLSPGWRQAIIWTNAKILLIGSLGTNFNEILIEIDIFLFKKMHLKMSAEVAAILSRPQCVNHLWFPSAWGKTSPPQIESL